MPSNWVTLLQKGRDVIWTLGCSPLRPLTCSLVGLLGLSLLWAGCSPLTHTGKPPVEIRCSYWGSAQEVALMNHLAKRFEATHPDIRIRLIHIPEHYFQKLHILMASELTPDVMAINSLSLPVYASSGQLMSLDKWMLNTRNTPVPLPSEVQGTGPDLVATEQGYVARNPYAEPEETKLTPEAQRLQKPEAKDPWQTLKHPVPADLPAEPAQSSKSDETTPHTVKESSEAMQLRLSTDPPLEHRDFFPASLQAMSFHNQLYAIPRDVSNLVVFINTDLFEQNGLELPDMDWTMADMLEKALVLTQDTNNDGRRDQFGISFYGQPPLLWMPYVLSQGVPLFDPMFTRFSLASSRGVRALQEYVNLRHRWHVAPTRQDVGQATMSQLFLQKKLAMMVSGRWSVPVLREQATFHWDVRPFPRGRAGSIVGIDASGYSVWSKTRYPKQSWAWVTFLSSYYSQRELAKSGLIIPARTDVAYSSVFLSPTMAPKSSQVFLDVMEHGYPTHTPVSWDEVSETITEALEPVWDGSQPVSVAMKKLKPKVEALLAR